MSYPFLKVSSLTVALQEISSPNSLILLWEEDQIVIGYVCGYFVNKEEFYTCQIYSRNPNATPEATRIYEKRIKDQGGKIVYAHTLHPTIFERYGFQLCRFIVRKDLEEKEMTEETFFKAFKARLASCNGVRTREDFKERVRQGVCPFDGLRKHFKDSLSFRKERRFYRLHISDESFKQSLLNLMEV